MENPHGLNTCGAHSFIVVLGICSFDFNWNKILHGLEERDFVKDILLLNGFLIGVIGPFFFGGVQILGPSKINFWTFFDPPGPHLRYAYGVSQ